MKYFVCTNNILATLFSAQYFITVCDLSGTGLVQGMHSQQGLFLVLQATVLYPADNDSGGSDHRPDPRGRTIKEVIWRK